MSKWGLMYSAATVFGVILIGAALALSIIYIQNYQSNDETYFGFQIGSVLMSTFIVLYIVVTIAFFRPYTSFAYTFGSCALLVGGLAAEIIVDQVTPSSQSKYVGLYMLAAINSIIRLFLLIQVRCDEPLTSIGDLLTRIKRDSEKVGAPAKDILKEISGPLSTMDPYKISNDIGNKLGSIDLGDKRGQVKDAIREALGLPPKQKGGHR